MGLFKSRCLGTVGCLVIGCYVEDFALAEQRNWKIVDLGSVSDRPQSEALGINDNSVVVGFCFESEGQRSGIPFVVQNGEMSALPMAGFSDGAARAINNAGWIVGDANGGQQGVHALLWRGGDPKSIRQAQHRDIYAIAITDTGHVAGFQAWTESSGFHVELDAEGNVIANLTLPTLGGKNGFATDVSADGVVIGVAENADQPTVRRACVWINGEPHDLGINHDRGSEGWAISSDNVGAGILIGKDEVWLWRDDSIEWPGELGIPMDINDRGDVLSVPLGGTGISVFNIKGLRSPDIRIDPGSGWTKLRGRSINNHRQIVGIGEHAGKLRAFLLTPPCFMRIKADANCDNWVDFNDIDPFVLAITRPSDYTERFPACDTLCANDTNDDGFVDFDDIDNFVQCLIQGGCEN